MIVAFDFGITNTDIILKDDEINFLHVQAATPDARTISRLLGE